MIILSISKVACDMFIHWKFDKDLDLKVGDSQYNYVQLLLIILFVDYSNWKNRVGERNE
jgi:hypothetical protein